MLPPLHKVMVAAVAIPEEEPVAASEPVVVACGCSMSPGSGTERQDPYSAIPGGSRSLHHSCCICSSLHNGCHSGSEVIRL